MGGWISIPFNIYKKFILIVYNFNTDGAIAIAVVHMQFTDNYFETFFEIFLITGDDPLVKVLQFFS